MSEERFDLAFAGELIAGADAVRARERLAAAFKLDPTGVERLFSGRAVTLKRAADADTVARYRRLFEGAGAILRVKPLDPNGISEARTPADGPPSPEASGGSRSGGSGLTLATADGFLEEPRRVNIDAFDTRHLSLVAGSDWDLADCDRPARPVPIPDIAHLSLVAMEPRTQWQGDPGRSELAE